MVLVIKFKKRQNQFLEEESEKNDGDHNNKEKVEEHYKED